MDADSHRAALGHLLSSGVSLEHLQCRDFFSSSADLPKSGVDAVVGNPPFIRYQQFGGDMRDRAAALMRREGVRVTELASSWAPFLVAGASLLRAGGRLAMVVPMELCHATYALPVLAYLSRSFKLIQLLSFGERIFPQLSQDTLLLLADSKGSFDAEFRWKHLADSSALADVSVGQTEIQGGNRLDASAISSGRERLIEQFLPRKARELYAELRKHPGIRPLATIAEVGIGYVTGANDFFHPSEEEVRRWDLPLEFLRRAVCRGRALAGLRFRESDWAAGLPSGSTGYLLQLPPRGSLPASVRRYIVYGEKRAVHHAYKCRVRNPWYTVPHVHLPDALLTYMSGVSPRLVANDAAAVAPNTLHVVRMLPLSGFTSHSLAAGWHSSLTRLSVEIQGHAMGGGLLKLEPLEAGRVLLALPSCGSPSDLCDSLDRIARHAAADTVRLTVDRMTLRDRVGLTEAECRLLDAAAQLLRNRRLGRAPKTRRTRT